MRIEQAIQNYLEKNVWVKIPFRLVKGEIDCLKGKSAMNFSFYFKLEQRSFGRH